MQIRDTGKYNGFVSLRVTSFVKVHVGLYTIMTDNTVKFSIS